MILYMVLLGYSVIPISFFSIIANYILKRKNKTILGKKISKILLFECVIPLVCIFFSGLYACFFGINIVIGWYDQAYGLTGFVYAALLSAIDLAPAFLYCGVMAFYWLFIETKNK